MQELKSLLFSMCQYTTHKRSRSDSGSTPYRQGLHAITPESSLSLSSYDDSLSEYDSEPEAETSFESPASLSSVSSYASLSSWGPSTPRAGRKRQRIAYSPAQDNNQETTDAIETVMTRPLSAQRDEIVAAILTIASALGLTKETLHVCVDLLDRYLVQAQETNAAQLETLSIACLWLAVKFIETPETIIKKSIKQILKRRRHSGNWTWQEIIHQEGEILNVLNFRLMSPTVLSTLQARIHSEGKTLSHDQRQLAFYFADLLLLKDRANQFAKELVVDAIWFVITGHQIANVRAPLLAPVVLLFLAHRDNINPQHTAYKIWFALRCQYGPTLQAPWQLPYDPKCECRVCEHTEDHTRHHNPAVTTSTTSTSSCCIATT